MNSYLTPAEREEEQDRLLSAWLDANNVNLTLVPQRLGSANEVRSLVKRGRGRPRLTPIGTPRRRKLRGEGLGLIRRQVYRLVRLGHTPESAAVRVARPIEWVMRVLERGRS
jgi:hypothetical protein